MLRLGLVPPDEHLQLEPGEVVRGELSLIVPVNVGAVGLKFGGVGWRPVTV
jgi:hypothetical protein